MLLALLLHLVLFHLLTARDAPPRKDTEYKVQKIDSCPSVGYYFRREATPNNIEPETCYLCFCQEDNTAVCWKRDNRRCNKESFHYHGVGKRDTRIRRSPGFADIFFRDASRDFFDKNEKTQCKPFESSFSDDCPPADWCIGCTVCDCDANGRWDCHVLSFCPDERKKAKRKGRKVVAKKPTKKPKPNTSAKRTPTTPPKNKKPVNKSSNKTITAIKREGNKNTPPQKRIIKKSIPLRLDVTPGPNGRKTPIRYKKISTTKSEPAKEKIIKKNVATHKPIDIKATKVNLEMEIAQKMMKKVMANLRKSMSAQVKDMSKIAQQNASKKNSIKNVKKPAAKSKSKPKKVNKRHVKKSQIRGSKKPKKPTKKPMKKPIKKPIYNPKYKPTRKPTSKKYVRNKRDLNTVENNFITTIITQANSRETANNTALISLIPVTSNLVESDVENTTLTPLGSNTFTENGYYKYDVALVEPQDRVGSYMGDPGITQVNMTETVINLLGTQITSISTENSILYNEEANKIIRLTELSPEANDLKFSKWTHLKILKEKKTGSDKHKSLVKLVKHTNKTVVLEDVKNRSHGISVERKLNAPKFNIVKLLQHPKCKKARNGNKTNVQKATKNIGDLQNLLSNLLKEARRNGTTSSPRKNKKFSVLRYLKKIFNKIFRRKKKADQMSKHHLLQTLCENFGPCRISKKDKILLDAKLTKLDNETTKILKTVKIIKGLLKLVDLPKSSDSDMSKQENFRNDIHKLNNILKGSFVRNQQIELTETQQTQIGYIKKNTQDFIQSVSKFASLLNEIIAILKKHDTNIFRTTTMRTDNVIKNITRDDPFQSLRNLLVRYNLIQNTFMKRMYEQLNYFENQINEKPKVSEVKALNNSVAIENFSRNIIQNLRKLKRLAQTVSYSGRAKRETMRDDDAIEYLLMLMEYLLKQNHPLDAAPVNDGIDLLIEAIKNAPDIKPIKKKVLEYTPATYADSTTTPSPKPIATEGSISDDDSPSDSDKTSSEDSGRLKLEDTEDTLKTKIDENKELVEMVADDDKDPEDKYQYDRRAGAEKIEEKVDEKIDEVTEAAYYNRIDENVGMEPDTGFETTTLLPIEMEISDKLDNQEDNAERSLAIEHNNIPVAEPLVENGSGDKKFEVFTADMDEEIILPGSSTTLDSDVGSTITTEYSTQAKKSRTKMRHLNLESYDSESVDKKSKLEWIEENFGRDVEEKFTDMYEINATQAVPTPHTSTSTHTTDKIDVSSLTRETVDENEKNKKKMKINAEDVMLRKQMDLLNSLDYGTEKGELLESDSKDGNNEDRYSSDTFPSYFV